MRFLDTEMPPLGMGCWPIGGRMYAGTQSLGYTGSDDATSIRTIHAALDGGIRLFDTAAAYGAGHSERLLAEALKDRPEALIATKIGIGIDEAQKQISFDTFRADMVASAVDGSLTRLGRDRIDLILLHINEMPPDDAAPIFDALDMLVAAGKIRAYGWSTDISANATALAKRPDFRAVEYAMNIFFDAPRMRKVTQETGLLSLIRSPLAMGLLSGKYENGARLPDDDIRASRQDWMAYFSDGAPAPDFMKTLDAVRDLLMSDGRTLVEGALAWIWGLSAVAVPIPGARTVEQIEGLTSALAHGALPPPIMDEIAALIPRNPDEPDRPR